MKRMVEEILSEEERLDDCTISEAIAILSKFHKDAKLNFLRRWDYDIHFEVVLEREQTDEAYAAELAKKQAQDTAEQVREYEKYLLLKAKFEEKT
jgi:hypothetical protein